MPRRGLGRGLDALIPTEEGALSGLLEAAVDEIIPNPRQPRSAVRDQDVAELAASIGEHGIIQPLIVARRAEGGYQLIAGERRWRAAKLAGLKHVPVIVKDAAPQQMLELALVENVQRADLNPLEEALAYEHLAQDFGLSQADIARRVGKSRVAVTNVMRLLQATDALKQALLDGRISEGHGRALLGLTDAVEQEQVLDIVIRRELSVRQTEALVQKIRDHKAAPQAKAATPEVRALEERFQASLGTRVQLRAGHSGGRVVIYYYSDEEFQALYQRLTGEEL